jgi:radical SAM superfamily enzyme YgiQ (UPF0313 family)
MSRVRVLLLSTYDLGRQPFGLASPAAWLRDAGLEARPVDLSRTRFDAGWLDGAGLAAVYLPMHTATRLALPVLDRLRALAPDLPLCAYGLYAPLNDELLRAHGVTHVLGPEFEADLVTLARAVASGAPAAALPAERSGRVPALPRLAFVPPAREALPPPAAYAALRMPDGTRRVVGATDATRGCKHTCRHCPIVPVYGGQFRVVPVDVVLADIRQQVAAGATHITFGDPDFLNGPAHARRIVEALHAEWPALTYDVTIKVEHLRRHDDLLPLLRDTGCAFVTSAVESVDDAVLAHLAKGHTRSDVETVAGRCREVGLTLVPTFVAFTPWTSLPSYVDLLDTVDRLGLVEHVAPVQWTIRLLVTWRSPLLELPDVAARAGAFDARTLTYPWRHATPAVDALQDDVMRSVGVSASRPRRAVFEQVRALAYARLGRPLPAVPAAAPRATVPYLDEPWYC